MANSRRIEKPMKMFMTIFLSLIFFSSLFAKDKDVSKMSIASINVRTNGILNAQKLLTRLPIEKGESLDSNALKKTREILLKYDRINDIEIISDTADNGIDIDLMIKESFPIAFTFDKNWKVVYENGKTGGLESDTYQNLPVIHFTSGDAQKRCISFLIKIRNVDIDFYNNISELEWIQQDDYFTVHLSSHKRVVLFKENDHLKETIQYLDALKDIKVKEKEFKGIIDLRFRGYAYLS